MRRARAGVPPRQVVTDPGNTYDRHSIERWLSDHDSDPLTNEQLALAPNGRPNLVPNLSLRSQIATWREENNR